MSRQMTKASRTEIQARAGLIDWRNIQPGDVVESWTGNGDEMVSWGARKAERRDLAGRWADEEGYLVHASHGGHEDVGPVPADFELCVLVSRGAGK